MISIVIITLNEGHKIGNTLMNASKLSNDIIVVDSGSNDNTKAICQSFVHVRFYERSWDGYGNQKNFGNDLAINDWVFSIDADEVLDEKLIKSIQEQVLSPAFDAFFVKFNTYIGNTRIRFGAWNPEKHVRLFNKTKINWSNQAVHECLNIKSEHRIGVLDGTIHHYSYSDISQLKEKAEKYSDLFVQRMRQAGGKPKLYKLFLSPPFTFINEYFIRLGFLDGSLGFHIAFQNSRYTFLKYYKCLIGRFKILI